MKTKLLTKKALKGHGKRGVSHKVREVTAQRCAERVVKRWEDDVILPDTMNAALLSLIRQDAHEHPTTDTKLGKRSDMSRQHTHNMLHADMALSIPLLVKWCNGRRVELAYLVTCAAICIRLKRAGKKSP